MQQKAYKLEPVVERSSGEDALRQALRALPFTYTVHYEPQRNLSEHIDPYDRALFAVVTHSGKGVLALALKTGEVTEEPGGLINQFQERRAYYKVLDPIKQAKLALQSLARDFDGNWQGVADVAVAVCLPDTHRSEFTTPQNEFFFAEDIQSPHFAERLAALFKGPQSGVDAASYQQFSGYLARHSAAPKPVDLRAERIRKLAEAANSAAKTYVAPEDDVEAVEVVPEPAPAPQPQAKAAPAKAEPVMRVAAEVVNEPQLAFGFANGAEPIDQAPDMQCLKGNMLRKVKARTKTPAQLAFSPAIHAAVKPAPMPEPTFGEWIVALFGGTAVVVAVYFGAQALTTLIR